MSDRCGFWIVPKEGDPFIAWKINDELFSSRLSSYRLRHDDRVIAVPTPSDLSAQADRIAELAAALREWGTHKQGCASWLRSSLDKCTCGLDAALGGPNAGE